jgi:hypothetical protein
MTSEDESAANDEMLFSSHDWDIEIKEILSETNALEERSNILSEPIEQIYGLIKVGESIAPMYTE